MLESCLILNDFDGGYIRGSRLSNEGCHCVVLNSGRVQVGHSEICVGNGRSSLGIVIALQVTKRRDGGYPGSALSILFCFLKLEFC